MHSSETSSLVWTNPHAASVSSKCNSLVRTDEYTTHVGRKIIKQDFNRRLALTQIVFLSYLFSFHLGLCSGGALLLPQRRGTYFSLLCKHWDILTDVGQSAAAILRNVLLYQ